MLASGGRAPLPGFLCLKLCSPGVIDGDATRTGCHGAPISRTRISAFDPERAPPPGCLRSAAGARPLAPGAPRRRARSSSQCQPRQSQRPAALPGASSPPSPPPARKRWVGTVASRRAPHTSPRVTAEGQCLGTSKVGLRLRVRGASDAAGAGIGVGAAIGSPPAHPGRETPRIPGECGRTWEPRPRCGEQSRTGSPLHCRASRGSRSSALKESGKGESPAGL